MKNATDERNRDFIDNFLSIARRKKLCGEPTAVGAILAEALARPPRCHYVSYDRAAHILHRIDRFGIEAVVRPGPQRSRWLEIHAQVREAMDGPRRLRFDKALSFVLSFRRPSRFYLEPARAIRLVRPYITIRYEIRS